MPAIKIFVIIGIYTLTCISFGGLILRLLQGKDPREVSLSPWAMLLTAFLLGQGILANLWVLVALAGWFSPAVVVIVMAVCFLAGIPFVLGYLRPLLRQTENIARDLILDSWEWKIVAFLIGYLTLGGITCLGAGLQGDAVNFYMSLPKVIAASHRLSLLPGKSIYYPLGLQGEMHYAALMSLGLADAVRLFTWITALAGALLLCALGSHVGVGRRGQWLILGMVFTSTAVLWVTQGKTDLFSMSLGIATYYWAIQKGKLQLRLCGLFAGLTLIAKTSYLLTLLPGLLILEIWQHRNMLDIKASRSAIMMGMQALAKSLFIIGFWMIIALIPHLIKNGVLLGNPLSFIYNSNPKGWHVEMTGYYSPRLYLTYLVEVTFGDYRYYDQLGNISPWVLAFLPLTVLLPRPKTWHESQLLVLTLSAAIGTLLYVIIFPGYIMPRYILATLFLIGLPAIRAIEHAFKIDRPPHLLTIGGMVSIVIILISTALNTTASGTAAGYRLPSFYPQRTWKYLTKGLDACELGGAHCQVFTVLNQQAKAGSRVLMDTDVTYWLRPDLQQCASDKPLTAYITQDSTGKVQMLWNAIFEEGFSYLIIDKNRLAGSLENLQPPSWVQTTRIAHEEYMEIYRLDYIDPPTAAQWACEQVRPPAWDIFRLHLPQ